MTPPKHGATLLDVLGERVEDFYTPAILVVIPTPLSSRVRKRRVATPMSGHWDGDSREATATGAWVIDCEIGGTVANAYRYAALTECVVSAAAPDGRVALWYATIPANKATRRGAGNACLSDVAGLMTVTAGDIWDARVGPERQLEARKRLIDAAINALAFARVLAPIAVAPGSEMAIDLEAAWALAARAVAPAPQVYQSGHAEPNATSSDR